MDQRHQWITMYRAKHLVLRHEPIRRFFLNFHMFFTYTYTCAHTYVDYTYNISMSNFENTLHAWRSRQHESATIGPAGLLILGKNDENECWIQLFGKGNLFFHILHILSWCSLYQARNCAKVSKGRSNLLPGGKGYEAPVGILFIAHETKTWASGDLKSCLTASQQAWWGSLEIAVMQDVSTNNTNITMGESTRSSQIRG